MTLGGSVSGEQTRGGSLSTWRSWQFSGFGERGTQEFILSACMVTDADVGINSQLIEDKLRISQ
jgi:hypothetical protein